jgi:CDP-glycerol glycerophosphotransferase (TagB/SpsB family)
LKPYKKNILLISWPIVPHVPYKEKKVFFQSVYKSIKKIKNVRLIIKPHPNESPEALKQHIKIWGMNDAKIIQTLNLLELLAVSDVMVMIWSMAAFEAIAMDVPVIAVNFAKKDYDKHIPYAEEKGAIEVRDEKQLFTNLTKLLEDKNYHDQVTKDGLNFAQKYVGPLDEKAAERIIKIIDDRN